MIDKVGGRRRQDVIAIPVIWLAFVLSLTVHFAALWNVQLPVKSSQDTMSPGEDVRAPMTARLEEPSTNVPESRPPSDNLPAHVPPSVPQRRASSSRPAQHRSPAPPSKALIPPPSPAAPAPSPASSVAIARPVQQVAPPPDTTPLTRTLPSPPAADLSAFIAEQRRARGQTDPADLQIPTPSLEESEIARRDRIVAQNLASINAHDFGKGSNSGGVFQITRLGYSDAEFTFFGWNLDINRRASQRIDVRRGNNPDIRIAVVREMITIIRRYESEDFVWESRRLGRKVALSARPADTVDLESFMMREFFDEIVSRP